MPVDLKHKLGDGDALYQREVYANSRITRLYWDHRDRRVLSYIGPQHERIVDIGCGEGITLERLIAKFPGRQICGLDGSEENIEICQTHGLPVVYSDVYDLKLGSESADCCLFLEVIEHLHRPEDAVNEIYRVLCAGGRAVIVFPNDRMFKIARMLTGKWKEAGYESGHVRQWIPGDLAGMLSSNGFRVVASKSIPFVFWPVSLHHIIIADKC
jgi:2-polyprenyl-3-methyl-5-hydroxy-6-metoxy-1,4-benzoquinol methylase